MTVYLKQNNVWVAQAGRPHIKSATGGWTPVLGGYVKRAGVWTPFYTFDSTPPAAPTITAALTTTVYDAGNVYKRGRQITVSVHVGSSDVTDVRRVRILVSTTAQPTSQYDTAHYIDGADLHSAGGEPWSEIWYHGFESSTRSSTVPVVTRTWTRGAIDSTVVAAGKYFFSAWAEDFSGNWSAAGTTSITLATGFDTAATTTHTSTFSANAAGSYTKGDYVGGDQRQANNPVSRGLYLYGTKFNALGKTGTNPQIKSAQIFLHRRNDSGQPNANVYLFAHGYPTRADLPADPSWGPVTKIGTIAKGESKWFSIPETMWTNLENHNNLGFGLNYKSRDAASTDNDFSVMKALADASRSGEVKITWTEEPPA